MRKRVVAGQVLLPEENCAFTLAMRGHIYYAMMLRVMVGHFVSIKVEIAPSYEIEKLVESYLWKLRVMHRSLVVRGV